MSGPCALAMQCKPCAAFARCVLVKCEDGYKMAMEFNRIITLLRKERGITQKQAAQELGISPGAAFPL